MLELQRQRLLAKFRQLDHSLAKRPRSDAGAVERRIRRWLSPNSDCPRFRDWLVLTGAIRFLRSTLRIWYTS
jgi:hypothetical protein